MPVEILLRAEVKKYFAITFTRKQLVKTVERLLEQVNHADAELSILLTGNREIKKLNLLYRGKNSSTDVLSFPLTDRLDSPIAISSCLGDIVISLQRCKSQAKDHGVAFEAELLRLLIHGLLHLLGYDHDNVTKKEARRMQAEEQRLMKALEAVF